MALSVKREILSQLKRIGLNVDKSKLKVVPSSMFNYLNDYNNHQLVGIGRTFYIDLPTDTEPMLTSITNKINHDLIKNIKNNSTWIKNIEIRFNESPIDSSKKIMLFEVNFEFLVKELFKDLQQNLAELFSYHRRFNDKIKCENYLDEKIIIEYSSPNIAKPFHVGNLRSTIIGNSVANILQFKGHQVLRMNYLGDWGTQFGILSLAYDRFGDENKLKTEPLKHLFDVYVKGNQECEVEENWKNQAKERFQKLELQKDSQILKQWIRFRELSFLELEHLYERLGIKFDIYTSESMYSGCSNDVIKILKERGLVITIDGAVYTNISHYNDPDQTIQVPLLKNDGTSLYLTRDIAAVLHRRKQYAFDRMYYIVDSSQAKHFNNLKSIFYSLDDPIYQNIKHLKFGRIFGMSTRKGDAIFLDDVLNEAKNRALESIKSSPNTKIPQELYEQVADVLGVASVIIHDLSNRRVKEYKFNWDRALKMNGNTGISLQYTHSRLCSLMKNCSFKFDYNCDINTSAINTMEGRFLINQLLMFDEAINLAYDQLEPSILTNYLFELKRAINRANQELTIKGQTDQIVQTRLLLFICAKNVLNECMKLLGLRPLESM